MADFERAGDSLVFEGLIAHLRAHGFIIGVDHYLRLQQLLSKLGDDCAPEDLKTLLCPIFATDKAQQEQFYNAFDACFEIFQASVHQEQKTYAAKESITSVAGEAGSRTVGKWPYLVAGSLLILLAFVLSLLMLPRQPAQQDALPAAGPLETGEIRTAPEIVQPPASDQTAAPAQPAAPPQAPAQPSAVPELNFYQRNRNAILLTAVLAPILILSLYELYRFNRRKLVLQKRRSKRPPFVWPIQIDSSSQRVHEGEQFYTAARLMRRRQIDEFHRIDVDATIRSTIESLGYPRFRYRPDSKPSEYLVLIDRLSPRDHQARLFDELSKALSQEAVFVERVFYNGDPRICAGETGEPIHLIDLQRKYAEHRLLIFGDGEKMIDPVKGGLAVWAEMFSDWKDRALLTPEEPERWGVREFALSSQFVLLPATVEGLLALVDHFEGIEESDVKRWLRHAASGIDRHSMEDVDSLRAYLGPEVFQWLCACAVYPELHWDLTVYLGSLPGAGDGLIREENLLRLIRLPWFRPGSMPDELRWRLIREFDRDKEKEVRKAIIGLLESNPPPEESIAEDGYRLNLAVQRWLFLRNRKARREMMRALRSLPDSQALRDVTLLRYLESSSISPLSLLLPKRLRNFFYRDSIPEFGLKTGARIFVTLIVMAVGTASVGILIPPPGVPLPPDLSAQATEPPSEAQSPNRNTLPERLNDSPPDIRNRNNAQPSLVQNRNTPRPPRSNNANESSQPEPNTVPGRQPVAAQNTDPSQQPPNAQVPEPPSSGGGLTSGSLTGKVFDESGMPMAGAKITVVNEENGNTRSTISGVDGTFNMGFLPPGFYSVTATLPNYLDATLRRFPIRLGRTNVILPPDMLLRRSDIFSPDGSYYITISANTVSIRDARTSIEVSRWRVAFVIKASFSPDGKYVVTRAKDGTSRTWDWRTGKQLFIKSK